MKIKKFLFLSLSMALVMFSSCKTDEVTMTGITLDETTWSLGVGDTTLLVATIQPAGVTETITWASADPTIATVTGGRVLGVKMGSTNITATAGSFTATCMITVTERTDFSPSLTGSEYYPIILDAITAEKLAGKIVADFRVEDATRFLYVWDDTYTAGTATGPNFYKEVEGWVSLTVASVGWSGAGISVDIPSNTDALASLKAITDNPEGYYLHIGIKSRDNASHAIILGGQTDIKFTIGASGFVDQGVTFPALADFTRDGEWHEIEIPMTTLKTMGLTYSNYAANNLFAFLSGGVAGTTLDLDAVFIYKK